MLDRENSKVWQSYVDSLTLQDLLECYANRVQDMTRPLMSRTPGYIPYYDDLVDAENSNQVISMIITRLKTFNTTMNE